MSRWMSLTELLISYFSTKLKRKSQKLSWLISTLKQQVRKTPLRGFLMVGSLLLLAHTHIPTADAWILPKGTAFVTDIGMSGALHSVLGVDPAIIIKKQKDTAPAKFEWVETGPKVFRSVLIETDKKGLAKSIIRIDKLVE